MRGLAVLPFEDNPLSKIGVIFDEIVHGGVFLAFSPWYASGEPCQAGTGDLDKLLINTLFEVLSISLLPIHIFLPYCNLVSSDANELSEESLSPSPFLVFFLLS